MASLFIRMSNPADSVGLLTEKMGKNGVLINGELYKRVSGEEDTNKRQHKEKSIDPPCVEIEIK